MDIKHGYFKLKNPFVINWEYTNACQLRCPFCTIPFKNSKSYNKYHIKILQKELPKKDFQYLFDIEGGEPTLDKTVFDLPKHFQHIESYFSLYTNFHNIQNLEPYQRFLNYPRTEITISFKLHMLDNDYYNLFKKNLIDLGHYDQTHISIIIPNNFILKNELNNILKDLEITCSELKIDIYYNYAENFKYLTNEQSNNYFKDKVTECRVKYNFKGYKCKPNIINIFSSTLEITNCSENFKINIFKFKIDLLDKFFVCRNNICGIQDYQIGFEKIKEMK
jgi:MoaA/NifB/PqqE/SkfB family radical SAM enzyme